MSEDDPFTDALHALCQDVSFDEAMENLYLMAKIETGLKQIEEGKVIDEVEAWKRMRSWLG